MQRNISPNLTPDCRLLLQSWHWPRNAEGFEDDILGSPGADFWDRWGFAHWFLRCPGCQTYPLARVQLTCDRCGVHLHRFRLAWIPGRSKKLPGYLHQARELGPVVESDEAFSLEFDCYLDEAKTRAFTELACTGILKLAGSDLFHVNRSCRGSLPSFWRGRFHGSSGPYSGYLPPEAEAFAYTQIPVHQEDYHDG